MPCPTKHLLVAVLLAAVCGCAALGERPAVSAQESQAQETAPAPSEGSEARKFQWNRPEIHFSFGFDSGL